MKISITHLEGIQKHSLVSRLENMIKYRDGRETVQAGISAAQTGEESALWLQACSDVRGYICSADR